MVVRRERFLIGAIIILVLAAIAIPYLVAWRNAGENYLFNGFLLNPLDGNSYLAKMHEGWRGDIGFTLPYTAEKGEGAYLFLFYLFLGRIARLFDISLIATFHLARVLSTLLMYLCLYRFFVHTFTQVHMRIFAFLLAAIGSGLGWIALLFGRFTSDFWVAEAYPFLSAFSNPHFSLGMAIVLSLFTFTQDRNSGLSKWLIVLLSLLLAILLPFGVVLVLLILAGLVVWEGFPRYSGIFRGVVFQRLAWIGLGGIPVLVYDIVVTYQDPFLKIWNSQNLTLSPPLWDLLISLSPLVFLALVGVGTHYKSRERPIRLLITWAILGVVLLYLPWGLQRRFMMGLYIPICALAAAGLGAMARNRRGFALAAILITLLVLPTNLVILLSSAQAIRTHNPQIYLSKAEADALEWIATHTPMDAKILAAPETGLFIPAHTGRRVFYGHPYETVDAAQQKAMVSRFFEGSLSDAEEVELLAKTDYVFAGPREQQIGGYLPTQNLESIFTANSVRIYRVIKP
jgi:hypothetical protein